jgi:hypothetical protein
MQAYAELELAIHRWDATNYVVEMRFTSPLSDADTRLSRSEAALAHFDYAKLREAALDPIAYGTILREGLFASQQVQTTFSQAYSAARSQDYPLRLRLTIGASAPELQSLHWEKLINPLDDTVLVTSQQLLFSRYLSSLDWRAIRRRAKASLRALVVIANPTNISRYAPGDQPLSPIDVPGELQRVREGLGDIAITALASEGSATLNNITTHLRDDYDIVYMINHGAMIEGEPYIWLEQENGESDVVAGMAFVARLQEMHQLPTLVVLASCQSAGDGRGNTTHSEDGGAQAALGPRLAEIGVPAVLAMQENITLKTIADFAPTFFAELQRDGQIDRAMAAARGIVRDRHDWWVPVLFLRLKSGCIWYEPGFAEDRPGFDKWPVLLRHIRKQRSTPILGPGLAAPLIGSPKEIARRWSDSYNFPLEPHAQDDLPQVAQFLAVNQGERLFPHEELEEFLRNEMLRLYRDDMPADIQQAKVDQMMGYIGAQQRSRSPTSPYAVLASLPFPIYINTTPDNLITQALIAAGKEPQEVFCPWNSYLERHMERYDDEPDPQTPLVYQLFGRINEPETLVLTEDDYFDFLIGFTGNKDMIPEIVRRVFADSALLFLGFRMDDWDFKVLFRSIMSMQGGSRRRDYTNIAVQIDPEEGVVINTDGARRYLQSYFQEADISIYWGSVQDFCQELYNKAVKK